MRIDGDQSVGEIFISWMVVGIPTNCILVQWSIVAEDEEDEDMVAVYASWAAYASWTVCASWVV